MERKDCGMLIEIFTDGSSRGNPGPGGYGIIMRAPSINYEKRFAEGFRLTTNNRMELLSVIVAIEMIRGEGHDVHIYSDSRYVTDAINKGWLKGWVQKGFAGKKNPDLWRRYLSAVGKHRLTFHWIKGHSSHTENEACDKMAVDAASAPSQMLHIDHYFETIEIINKD
jgi:ribonuclease HI